MKRKAYVKRAIITFVKQNSFLFYNYSNWYVGVTANPKTRNGSHGKPNLWRVWETDHHDHAREIEKHFLALGFKGAPGGGTRTKYVYIYKYSGPGA